LKSPVLLLALFGFHSFVILLLFFAVRQSSRLRVIVRCVRLKCFFFPVSSQWDVEPLSSLSVSPPFFPLILGLFPWRESALPRSPRGDPFSFVGTIVFFLFSWSYWWSLYLRRARPLFGREPFFLCVTSLILSGEY